MPLPANQCARCRRPVAPLLFTSGNAQQQQQQDLIEQQLPTGDGEFYFIDKMNLNAEKHRQLLQQALLNMKYNAEVLRDLVKGYLGRWALLGGRSVSNKDLSMVVQGTKVIVSHAVPMGSMLVNLAENVCRRIWGLIPDICKEVVERSCADILMAIQMHGDPHSARTDRELAASAFLKMRDVLVIESYENIKDMIRDVDMRGHVSSKFVSSVSELANSYVLLMQYMQLQEQELRLQRYQQQHWGNPAK